MEGFLIIGQLLADITGQEIICRSPSVGAIGLSVEIHIDNAAQVACQFLFGLAGIQLAQAIADVMTSLTCIPFTISFFSKLQKEKTPA